MLLSNNYSALLECGGTRSHASKSKPQRTKALSREEDDDAEDEDTTRMVEDVGEEEGGADKVYHPLFLLAETNHVTEYYNSTFCCSLTLKGR